MNMNKTLIIDKMLVSAENGPAGWLDIVEFRIEKSLICNYFSAIWFIESEDNLLVIFKAKKCQNSIDAM